MARYTDGDIRRAKLQEQNALSEEIVDAMNSINLGNQIDEVDLEAELDELRQEELDQKMLETGTVPVDAIQRLPAAGTKERKLHPPCAVAFFPLYPTDRLRSSKGKANRGGRRRGRAQKAASRDGHVMPSPLTRGGGVAWEGRCWMQGNRAVLRISISNWSGCLL